MKLNQNVWTFIDILKTKLRLALFPNFITDLTHSIDGYESAEIIDMRLKFETHLLCPFLPKCTSLHCDLLTSCELKKDPVIEAQA